MITFPIWYSIPLIAALVAGGFAMAMVLMQNLPPDQREVVRLEIANRAMAQALRDLEPLLYRIELLSGERPLLTPTFWAADIRLAKQTAHEALARAAGVLGGDPLRRLDMEPVAAEGERRVPRG